LLIVGYIYKGGNTLASVPLWVSYGTLIAYFVAINLLFFFLLKRHKKKDAQVRS